MANKNDHILLLDEENAPILIASECAELKPVFIDFVKSWVANHDQALETWLPRKMQEALPERTPEEIKSYASDIITAIRTSEAQLNDLSKAVANGRRKEDWFASSMQQATSGMSAQESAAYLESLDRALQTSNEALYETLTTQAGTVSQNPNLDGFIAEQYHAQTFNMNAEAAGSPYRAKVLEPTGKGYAKNSVDLVIVDGDGKVVRRYQSKYCKDAQATADAFEKGDYRGQRKLVPEGQEKEVGKNATSIIEAPDGTKSNPLSKKDAARMRDEAQSGEWNDLNWNEYAAKDLAIGVGKQAGYAALQGVAVGVGFDIAQKLWKGEQIKGEEVIETALRSGADFGLKAAAAGALKVGAEKGIISVIPKGTPAGALANVAHVAVENIKIVGKMASGELSVKEGVERMEQVTVATVAGMATMGKGAALGASIGVAFGPIGAAIGGFVGGTIGYMAGSKVGETVVKGMQKIRSAAVSTVKTVGRGVVNGAKAIGRGLKSIVDFIF